MGFDTALATLGNITTGAVGSAIDYGLNAAAASKANDRSKNWATRKYQYELIALEKAGINPAYMFSDRGASSAGRSQSAQQAHGTKTNIAPASAGIQAAAMARLATSQANNQDAQAQQALAAARLNNAKAEAVPSEIDLNVSSAKRGEAETHRLQAEEGITRIKLQTMQDNPELVRRKMYVEGLPPDAAGYVMQALEEINWSDSATVASMNVMQDALRNRNMTAFATELAKFAKKHPRLAAGGVAIGMIAALLAGPQLTDTKTVTKPGTSVRGSVRRRELESRK